MPTYATRTFGALLVEARGLLNDLVPISGLPRFTDNDLIEIVNEGLIELKLKRPDAYLSYGLRKPIPKYSMPAASNVIMPFEDMFYSPLLFYVVGRAELVEDTFADNGRAITLLSKFNTLLLKNNG
jgi:hypothetical protein